MKDPAADKEYDDWLAHWGTHENPWRLRRVNQQLPQNMAAIDPADVRTDGRGNVIQMPLLVGVPCFGAPIVHRRFRSLQYWDPTRDRWQNFRCRDCNVKLACDKVALERLNADPEIARTGAVYRRVRRKNLKAKKSYPSGVERSANTRFRKALNDHGRFTNSNDDAARNAEDQQKRLRAQVERDRKSSAYERRFRHGNVPTAALEAARAERDDRIDRAMAYLRSGHAPRKLAQVSDDSARLTGEVWYPRLILRWRQLPAGPSDIARDLIVRGCHQGKSLNALRKRIDQTDLGRIAAWESEQWPGSSGPLWPRFSPPRTPRNP